MEGRIKTGMAIAALALVIGGFLLSVSPTQAQVTDQAGDAGNEDASARTIPQYSGCGGAQGCRTSCGCGCGGDPGACGCGG